MRLLCLLCVLSALLVQARAIDREAFTFTNYQLDVRVEPEQQRLAVRGRIRLRNDSTSPQKNLSLQISSTLDWRSIRLDGNPVQFVSQPYTSDIDHTGALSEAIVSLPRDVPPQGTVELEVGYEGTIPLDVTRLNRIGVPQEQARHTDWDQISKSFTAVRGMGYVAWYPVATQAASLSEGNSVFATVARWKAREVHTAAIIRLSHFSEGTRSTVLSNCQPGGKQTYEQPSGSGETVTECSFQSLDEIEPLFAMDNYEKLDQPPVNIFYRADHKPSAENYALAAQLVLPFVSNWFAVPPGHAEHRSEVVDLPDPQAAPYESGNMLLTPLSDDSKLARLTAVHQLTHSAFYSRRLWIYEGLAHFAQAVYVERESGRQAALDFMGPHSGPVADAEKALLQAHSSSESLVNTSTEEFYRSKAMYVWWMLRDMIGEEALKKALAAYRPDADESPSYMQHLIAAKTKRDLTWFFPDWVYRDRGLPNFHVESVYPRRMSGNNYVVTVTVENRADAGAEVPVILRMQEGQLMKRLEVLGRSKTTVRFEAASVPIEILVNDGSVPESDMSDNVYKIEIPTKND